MMQHHDGARGGLGMGNEDVCGLLQQWKNCVEKQGCLVSCICLPTSSGLAPERWLMAKMLVGWLAGWLREDTQQGVGMRKCDNASTQSVRETSGAQWPLSSPDITPAAWAYRTFKA